PTETRDSFTLCGVRRTGTVWEFHPHRPPRRRHVPVVRVHVAGRGDSWWAWTEDKLVEVDPLETEHDRQAKPDRAEALAMRDHELKYAGRVPTPNWNTRTPRFRDLLDRGI